MRQKPKDLYVHDVNLFLAKCDCSVAQRKRVGLITQRSSDRNRVEQLLFATYTLCLFVAAMEGGRIAASLPSGQYFLFAFVLFMTMMSGIMMRSG